MSNHMIDLYAKCRQYPNEPVDYRCPGCGFIRERMPLWVDHEAWFIYEGQSYRICSIGSTNQGTNGYHFRDIAFAQIEDHYGLRGKPVYEFTPAQMQKAVWYAVLHPTWRHLPTQED